jgi:hypothetical protein
MPGNPQCRTPGEWFGLLAGAISVSCCYQCCGAGAAAAGGDGPLYFTGEMMYPWMLDLDPALLPLREAARLLAERDGWPPLYDPARLAANDVPVAAAVYYDDLYVPAALSLRTAAAVRGLRAWVTNEWEHEGLRVSDGKVLGRLIAMNKGEA